MKNKIGDEVFVKGKIVKINVGTEQLTKVDFGDGKEALFLETELIPADKTYTQGLADAWELGRRFAYGDLSNPKKRRDIFGDTGLFACMNLKGGVEEALAKIEAYEREKEIRVGDVVKSGIFRGVITRIEGDSVSIIYEGGANGWANKRYCTKTGKHIDIEAVLRQIGE